MVYMNNNGFPEKQGLYDPAMEHDSCGVGFVVDIHGKKSNQIVKSGLEILNRLAHRGAVGADPKTGDGAGILIQMPHKFFQKIANQTNITLPKAGEYGSGLVFLPRDEKEQAFCKDTFAKEIKKAGQVLLGWRKVPVNNSEIGVTAKASEPAIEQVFIGKSKVENDADGLGFERKLYVIRKKTENAVRASKIKQKTYFYINSLSCRTFVYKGLLMTHQVAGFFSDLSNSDIHSAIALVHSRYSTNTFPTWDLAQPFRYLAHNGEINTLKGNINWMRAKEGMLECELIGKDLGDLYPTIVPGGSDSAAIDNVFELLSLCGKTLPETMLMLIPAAYHRDNHINQELKDYYKYQSCLMEPWDGPAAIAFTDGDSVGAVLDRNGLRPARYLVTKGGQVVMASEVGVLDIDPSQIEYSGRLEPGKMFFIDTKQGQIISDQEIKDQFSSKKPYGKWLKDNLVVLDEVAAPKSAKKSSKAAKSEDKTTEQFKAFGYSREDFKYIIKPMAETGQEPIGSMGNDTPHAVLSKNPQLLYSYFKQLFAQVTNPAVDPIREELVMTLETFLGKQKNLFEETPEHARKIYLTQPILANDDLAKIRSLKTKGFKAKEISLLFSNTDAGFAPAVKRIQKEAEEALKQGYQLIILSDKGVNAKKAALPALVAVGAVHQYLVKKAKRAQISIVLESAEPREVHHFGLLFGYGVDAVNPYLVFEAVSKLVTDKEVTLDFAHAKKNYIKSVNKGLMKILSKMGISTLQSYRGAQIFEALGVGAQVIEECFTGTTSRIGGVDFKTIAQETLLRHQEAFGRSAIEMPLLRTGGLYQWKRDGEFHLWNPESIAALQDCVRKNDFKRYQEFSGLINDQSKNPTTLRSLLKFKSAKPISIEEVEPATEIFKRLATGAMSFGSISKGAHETLAIAMNRLGGRSNTGEGGEDPTRFKPLPNGDSARSSIKQIASGRFGVTTNYLVNADEIQIKIAQGAKPGEGGQLPGHKVSAIIARTRYTTPGVTLISPPPHHDIYSIEDLAQLIFDLKNVNPRARISVKLVSEIGVGTVAAGVAKGHADMILISGGDGGTGASPLSSVKHAGMPWELGISETHQTLVLNDLRSRVRLQTDGQMRTGRDVAIAAILGAEEYGFCTAALIIMGCVMLRHCHLNNCSVGVATQDEILSNRFAGKPEYLINYFHFVAQELREIMSSLGIRKMDDLIGHTELLEFNPSIAPWKAKGVDYSRILYKPSVPETVKTRFTQKQDHGIDKVLDRKLIDQAKPALEQGVAVEITTAIKNSDRTAGAMLSGEVCRLHGESGLPEDTIKVKFNGIAGQSFGAWLAKGVTFELEGLSNDYVGKGISGGKIIIYPDKSATYKPEANILIGNTTFYGAIAGEAYIHGIAGERFCIRNSGLNGVVEGVGDHGCEYMTGGRLVILGRTGRNFGAGMSGGIAYVYDESGDFSSKCNLEMVELQKPGHEDRETINNLLVNHVKFTGSPKAKQVLAKLDHEMAKFVKVMPLEYKRILEAEAANKKNNEVSDG